MNPFFALMFAINLVCSAINIALYFVFGEEVYLLLGLLCGAVALIALQDLQGVSSE